MTKSIKRASTARRASFLIGSALAATVLVPATASAQDGAEAAADTTDYGNRVIIVTARQREENLQDVPLAITAFDAEALKEKNIESLDDVARFTAGLAFEDGQGGFAFPTIRGQSQLRTTAREQPTAVFINGVYLPRSWLVGLGVKDLERIEVVKGPQSSRYGRNAFSGAINYVSQSADLDELRVRADATYGNHERFDGGAAISMPVVPGVLAIRASYDHSESDGTWENTHPNNGLINGPSTEGNVGGWNREAYSVNVVFEPVEGLTISGRYNGFEIADEATPTYWLNSNLGDGNCGTDYDLSNQGGPFPGTPGGPRLFCGTYGVLDDTVEMDPRAYGRRVKADVYALNVDWEVSDAITLSYLFGKVEGRSDGQYTTESDQVDCGGIFSATGPVAFLGTLCNFQGGLTGSVDYDSHEIRASFDAGPLDIAVGGFYVDGEDLPIAVSVNVPVLATDNDRVDPDVSSFPDNIVFGRSETITEVKALFGEANYAFNNGATRFGVEVRYTEEEITDTDLRAALDATNPISDTFKFWTPRFTLEHDVSDNALLYATVARGAKAGGFNPRQVDPAFRKFDPEFNWTYELGAKTRLGGIATVNVAAFLTKWSGMQVTAADSSDIDPFSPVFTRNLGDATIYGFEVETFLEASENLTLDANMAYNSSTFDDGTSDLQYVARSGAYPASCDGVVCDPVSGDIGGNQLPRTPKFMASAGAEYSAPYNADGDEYFLRADVSYQDSFYANTINSAGSPSRFLANLRAGIGYGRFDIALWARNLFDKKYVTTSTAIVQRGGTNLFGAYYGERRTFGVTASFNY